MPKLLIIGTYPWIDGTPKGGPESVTKVLADGVAASGVFEAHVLVGGAKIAKSGFCETETGVKVHILPLLEKFGLTTGFFIDKRRLRNEIDKICPDIIHVQGTGFREHAARAHGCPVVLWISGISFKEARYERGLNAIRYKYSLKHHLDSLRNAENLILQNHYTYDTCREWLNPAAKVAIIDNPVDDAFFDIESNEEEGRLLIVAVMRRLKGHVFLIRAVKMLRSQGKQVTLHCIGPAVDSEYTKEIVQMISDEGLSECVRLLPRVTPEEILEHYSRSSVVILPSLVENAPVVISEAMSAGKAIVATPAGGICEMVENERTGLIVPMENSEALADAIGRLLDSPELRAKLGAAAKTVAEQRFRADVSIRKTLAFYEEVLGGAPDAVSCVNGGATQ